MVFVLLSIVQGCGKLLSQWNILRLLVSKAWKFQRFADIGAASAALFFEGLLLDDGFSPVFEIQREVL